MRRNSWVRVKWEMVLIAKRRETSEGDWTRKGEGAEIAALFIRIVGVPIWAQRELAAKMTGPASVEEDGVFGNLKVGTYIAYNTSPDPLQLLRAAHIALVITHPLLFGPLFLFCYVDMDYSDIYTPHS